MKQYINSTLEIRRKDLIKRITKDDEFHLSKGLYLSKNNWKNQILKLDDIKAKMTPARDSIDLIIDLGHGKRMYDGDGNLISSTEKQFISKNITERRDPWRAENLDNYFHNFNGQYYMDSEHVVINGSIVNLKSVPISFVRDEDGWTSFKYFNEDGLATKLKGKEVYFYPPNDNTVAGFYADSGGAVLDCDEYPSYSDPERGVRAKFSSIDNLEK